MLMCRLYFVGAGDKTKIRWAKRRQNVIWKRKCLLLGICANCCEWVGGHLSLSLVVMHYFWHFESLRHTQTTQIHRYRRPHTYVIMTCFSCLLLLLLWCVCMFEIEFINTLHIFTLQNIFTNIFNQSIHHLSSSQQQQPQEIYRHTHTVASLHAFSRQLIIIV